MHISAQCPTTYYLKLPSPLTPGSDYTHAWSCHLWLCGRMLLYLVEPAVGHLLFGLQLGWCPCTCMGCLQWADPLLLTDVNFSVDTPFTIIYISRLEILLGRPYPLKHSLVSAMAWYDHYFALEESVDHGGGTDSDKGMPEAWYVKQNLPRTPEYRRCIENPVNDWHTACNWLGHRTIGYNAVVSSRDYHAARWLMKDDMPQEVDHLGIVLPKRVFEKAMQRWRHHLKHLRRIAEAQVDCSSTTWLGGPEWMRTAPAAGDVPWPHSLIPKPRIKIVLHNQRFFLPCSRRSWKTGGN